MNFLLAQGLIAPFSTIHIVVDNATASRPQHSRTASISAAGSEGIPALCRCTKRDVKTRRRRRRTASAIAVTSSSRWSGVAPNRTAGSPTQPRRKESCDFPSELLRDIVPRMPCRYSETDHIIAAPQA